MRFVSPVALGMMLALGGMSLGAAVPSAMAKEKQESGPKINPSPGFLKAVQSFNAAVVKKDVAAAQAAMPAAKAAATTNDDKYLYNQLLLNLSILANDAAMQGEALRGMVDSGLTPANQIGQFSAIIANSLLNAKDYDGALAYAQKAQQAGYKPGEVNPILAQIFWAKAGNNKAEILRGLDAFRQGVEAKKAAGEEVPSQWYLVGVSKAAATDDLAQLKYWSQAAYSAQPTGENLRTILRVFQRQNPTMTNRENLDLLRLMNVSGGLALKPDFLEYAEMASKSGVFGEVKAAIDAGRAKGVLGTQDGSDYYSLANQRIPSDKASLAAATADAAKSATGKVAAATADAYMGYGDYAKAAQLYALALQKGGIDAGEAQTRLGIAKAQGGDIAGAKAALAQVPPAGTRGGIAKLWLDYLNAKSGQPAS